jgi:hypothetical protein
LKQLLEPLPMGPPLEPLPMGPPLEPLPMGPPLEPLPMGPPLDPLKMREPVEVLPNVQYSTALATSPTPGPSGLGKTVPTSSVQTYFLKKSFNFVITTLIQTGH